jgi:hypothetical protein
MWPVDLLTVSPLFAAAARIPVGALPTDIYLFALSLIIIGSFRLFVNPFKHFFVYKINVLKNGEI